MDRPLQQAPSIAGTFQSLQPPLTRWILDVVASMGFQRMTPVQSTTIPLFLKNKDVVVEAVTGSGKTLAFVIPIIERLTSGQTKLKKNQLGALIISPTRELAAQIYSVFHLFLSSQPSLLVPPSSQADESNETTPPPPPQPDYPFPLLLVSGSSSTPRTDIARFIETGADIVIGTPGRIEEFLLGSQGRKTVDVKHLELLVLDEADRLLDLGFTNSISKILSHLPKQRRTGLFSATMTEALSEIVRVGLRNPVRVVVKVESKRKEADERRIPAGLHNSYILVHPSEKVLQLVRLLVQERGRGESRFIVYFSTCAEVSYFYKVLSSLPAVRSFTFHSLHGQLPPAKRTLSLHNFTTHPSTPVDPSVLLCTDVAARGLDLPSVDVVIQFDPPVDPKVFAHRIGRTARAGRDGRSIVLLCGRNEGDPMEFDGRRWGREAEYVAFLGIRKIPMTERSYITAEEDGTDAVLPRPDAAAQSLKKQIQEKALLDREFYDKGIVAFVSFVRAYSKHEAAYIFRMSDLDLIAVAESYGLVRLPKMPELKRVDKSGWELVEYEEDNISYASALRESHRQKRLAERSEANDKARLELAKERRGRRLRAAVPWSDRKARQDAKGVKREKRQARKTYLRKLKDAEIRGPDQVSDANDHDRQVQLDPKKAAEELKDEWDDLQAEEREAKKARREASRTDSALGPRSITANFEGL